MTRTSWNCCALFAMVLCVIVGGFSTSARAADAAPDARLEAGSGSLPFPFVSGGQLRRITLWYHRPVRAGADAPVVFVLHGTSRTGENYRKYWIPEAEKYGFILLVPEFSRDQFPGSTYERGNMIGSDGVRLPESQWSYTAIEDIFDAVRKANALTAPTYDIYGHSAGGQFVHRLVFFKPGARFRVAVAANSGWYAMPDLDVAYPYGLDGSGIGPAEVRQALGRRLVVLLGSEDNDPEHHQLRRTPEAMQQGNDRIERGHTFYEVARRC
jgi:poly(3-hydroxybutyrate) depolymerase